MSCARPFVAIVWLLLLTLVSLPPTYAQTASTPIATVNLRDAKATPEGILASVTLSHADVFYAQVQQLDQGTGNWNTYLSTAPQAVPTPLANTDQEKAGSLTIPVLTPDGKQRYRLILFVSPIAQPNAASAANRFGFAAASYTNSSPAPFDGWSPGSLQPVSLRFNSDSLTVSAKTKSLATLTAGWQIESQNNPVGIQEQQNHQDPSVELKYADLSTSSSPSSLPAINIKLQDGSGNSQETILTISVNVSQQLKSGTPAAKAQPNKAKFSWSDLAKTGIAGLLTYFGTVL
jgi:hypothetical protein